MFDNILYTEFRLFVIKLEVLIFYARSMLLCSVAVGNYYKISSKKTLIIPKRIYEHQGDMFEHHDTRTELFVRSRKIFQYVTLYVHVLYV